MPTYQLQVHGRSGRREIFNSRNDASAIEYAERVAAEVRERRMKKAVNNSVEGEVQRKKKRRRIARKPRAKVTLWKVLHLW